MGGNGLIRTFLLLWGSLWRFLSFARIITFLLRGSLVYYVGCFFEEQRKHKKRARPHQTRMSDIAEFIGLLIFVQLLFEAECRPQWINLWRSLNVLVSISVYCALLFKTSDED